MEDNWIEEEKIVYENPEVIFSIEEEESLKRLDALAEWLDNKFVIPGTNIRFGLDFVLGLIPGIGDTITSLVATYVIKEAHDLDAPFVVKTKMASNIFADWLVGIVPILGDAFDIQYKANIKNVEILREYLKNRYKE